MRICEWEQCSKNIDDKPKTQRFCSLSCGQKFNAVRKCKVFYFECEYCNKLNATADRNKKFCNHSCSAIKSNLKRAKDRFCAGCNVKLTSENQKKYCSGECGSRHRSRIKIQSWLDGEWDGTTVSGLSYCISQYLKEQAGWRCQSPDCCVPGGWSVVNIATGKVPVEIDHIDGNCYNNQIENLVVLCPNCHSITETYKALNKNSGRTYRSKYKQFV